MDTKGKDGTVITYIASVGEETKTTSPCDATTMKSDKVEKYHKSQKPNNLPETNVGHLLLDKSETL